MRRDDGFSLAEVLITVMLLMTVSLITFGFFDAVASVSGRATRNVVTESDAQLVLREMTQELRGANPISATHPSSLPVPSASCAATPLFPTPALAATGYQNCIRFANSHSISAANFCISPEVGRVAAPYSMITYGLNNGVLYKDRTDYNASCAVVRSAVGRKMLTGVGNAGTTPPNPLFTYFDESGATIPNASVSDATSVKVSLVLPYAKSAPNLRLTSVASFRNN